MISRRKWPALALLLFSLSYLSTTAFAQEEQGIEAEKDQKKQEELGFHAGELIIHPGFSLQNIYGTNVTSTNSKSTTTTQRIENSTLVSTNSTTSKEAADDYLRIIGGVKLNYPSRNFKLTLDTQIQYAYYFGLSNENAKTTGTGTNTVTSPEIDTTSMSGLNGSARLSMSIFPEAVVSAGISDMYTFTTIPKIVALSETLYKHHNTANALLSIKPGGGQLRFHLGYTNNLDIYPDDSLKALNYLEHEVSLNSELEFFPKTAAFLLASWAMRDYMDWNPARVQDLRIDAQSPNAMPIKVMGGLYGRITSRFSLNAAAGYGNSMHEKLESYNMLIAKLEGLVKFTKRTQLKFGFKRDFVPIVTFAYRADNKPYLEFQQWFVNDSLRLYLHFAYSYVQYGTPDSLVDLDETSPAKDANGAWVPANIQKISKRSDSELSITPSIRYDPLKWIQIEAAYTLFTRLTDYDLLRITRNLDAGSTTDYSDTASQTFYDYTNHQILFKFSLIY